MSDGRFKFSAEINLTEQQFVMLNRLTSPKRWPFYITATAIVALLMLLHPFTFLVGVGLFIIPALAIFAPHKLLNCQEQLYRKSPYFRQQPVLSVSDKGLSFRTEQVEAEVLWSKPTVWQEIHGWLKISPAGFPACWFPVPDLKRAGVYDQLMLKCREFGVKFDSDEANRSDSGKQFRTIYTTYGPPISCHADDFTFGETSDNR
jgi:hypothetical protein